jgi:hypothetical protein
MCFMLYYRCRGAFLKKLKCFLMTKGIVFNKLKMATDNKTPFWSCAFSHPPDNGAFVSDEEEERPLCRNCEIETRKHCDDCGGYGSHSEEEEDDEEEENEKNDKTFTTCSVCSATTDLKKDNFGWDYCACIDANYCPECSPTNACECGQDGSCECANCDYIPETRGRKKNNTKPKRLVIVPSFTI